ncbi:MAG: hypoxanthine-guanine phosphoribosyltransferase [Gammaproteobacteria bacterium]
MSWVTDPVFAASRLVFDAPEIERAVARIAGEVTAVCEDRDPVVMPVLLGGLPFGAALLAQLQFQLHIDYVHVSRYRGGTQGGTLHWVREPAISLVGRQVLLVDDVLDEGNTLQALKSWCAEAGAAEVLAAVLVTKYSTRRAPDVRADFTGLDSGSDFLFGYGMDYQQRYRHLSEIRALPEEKT